MVFATSSGETAVRRSPTKIKASKSITKRSRGRFFVKPFAIRSIFDAAEQHLRFLEIESTRTMDHCWEPPRRPAMNSLLLLSSRWKKALKSIKGTTKRSRGRFSSRTSPSLPLPSSPWKKTVFLDLDETLIHSTTDDAAPERYDFIVYPEIDGEVDPVYVLKRPGADELLRAAAEYFEVVVFTAGVREYASLILDHLDPRNELISHRLYRDSCKRKKGKIFKDLSSVGRALDSVVLIDDNPNAYLLQPENTLPVTPFFDDMGDRELLKVMEFLEVARLYDDMRDAIAVHRSKYDTGDGTPMDVD